MAFHRPSTISERIPPCITWNGVLSVPLKMAFDDPITIETPLSDTTQELLIEKPSKDLLKDSFDLLKDSSKDQVKSKGPLQDIKAQDYKQAVLASLWGS